METSNEILERIIDQTSNKDKGIEDYLIQVSKENLSKKVDRKEWIPVLGMIFAIKDMSQGKPTILDDYPLAARPIGYRVYQGLSAIGLYAVSGALIIKYLIK